MCTAELFFPSWYGCVASKGYIACARKIRRMFTIQRVFAPRDGGLACLPLYVTMAPQSVWQLSPNHARFPEGGLSSRSPPSLLPTLYSSSGTTMTVVLAEIACTLQPSAHTLLRGFSGVEISKTDIDIRVADLSPPKPQARADGRKACHTRLRNTKRSWRTAGRMCAT